MARGFSNGYDRFYQWSNILRGALTKEPAAALRHLAYAGGWKKFEWLWHTLIRMRQVTCGLPLLERALDMARPRAASAPSFCQSIEAQRGKRAAGEVQTT